jgi:hypothetical protein
MVGINVNISADPDYLQPSVGFTYDLRLTKRSGFETGVFYRTEGYSVYNYTFDSVSMRVTSAGVTAYHLNIPVLYKFHTKIIDISGGPAFDVFLGWKQKSGKPNLLVNDFNVKPRIGIGVQAKVSRMFRINKILVIEPDIRYTTIQELGIGAALKMIL